MAGRFSPAQIDFSGLANLPAQFETGQQIRQNRDIRDVRKSLRNGEMDYGSAFQSLLAAGDIQGANAVDSVRHRRESLGLQRQRLAQSAQGQAGVFGTPIYGQDPESGETVVGAIGKDGTFRRLDTDGVNITPGVTFRDLGTTTQAFDKRTAAPVGEPVQIDVAGEAALKEEGKQRGEATVSLPGTIQKADQSIALIDKMLDHPGREGATGLSSVNPLTMVPGTDERDFIVASKQLEGKAFLEAFDSLKGGGHITEIEGQKATEAMGRLDRAQSDREYVNSLQELRGIIELGKSRARQRAGGGSQSGVTRSGLQWSVEP